MQVQQVHLVPSTAAALPHEPATHEYFLVTITGTDAPGITAAVTAAAAEAHARIVAIKQAVVLNRLTLTIQLLVDHSHTRIYRDLLLIAKQLAVKIEFGSPHPCDAHAHGPDTPSHALPTADSPAPAPPLPLAAPHTPTASPAPSPAIARKLPPNASYVLTILSASVIAPPFLAALSELLDVNRFEVTRITKLSRHDPRCLELTLKATQKMNTLRVQQLQFDLYSFGKERNVDIAFQADNVMRRSKRVVIMDMDSTLIQQEVIDELARHAGVYDQVQEITHRAMGGALDFNESLRQRVALLRGVPASAFKKVIDNLLYTPGAHELCRALKKLGYKLAVISGGFTPITQHVRQVLSLDYDYANTLEVGPDGKFTGRTIGPIVNAQRKADLLMAIAQQEGIRTDQVIAIGDGANDLPMLATAGLGIAFNAKPAVQKAANFRINQTSLVSVLYLLGFSEQDQAELWSSKYNTL